MILDTVITSTHKHTFVDALNNCAYFYAAENMKFWDHFTMARRRKRFSTFVLNNSRLSSLISKGFLHKNRGLIFSSRRLHHTQGLTSNEPFLKSPFLRFTCLHVYSFMKEKYSHNTLTLVVIVSKLLGPGMYGLNFNSPLAIIIKILRKVQIYSATQCFISVSLILGWLESIKWKVYVEWHVLEFWWKIITCPTLHYLILPRYKSNLCSCWIFVNFMSYDRSWSIGV